MPDINITGYENEDIDRQFTLRTGDAGSSVPFDITNADFESDIRDQNGNLVLRLTSTDGDGGIIKTDPANGTFVIHIDQGAITVQAKRSMKYDLLMRLDGELRRLWGGSVKISPGITVP